MTSYHCPACGHAVDNRTVHQCPPAEMTYAQAVDIATEAASLWADELLQYIAPASDDFGDPESAANQRDSADQIAKAIAVLRKRNHA